MSVSDLAYLDDTGYHYADYPAFLAWLKDQYRGVYGADVYLEPDSQDGQWVAIQAKALYDTATLGGSIYNSFSPVSAQGTGLARLVKINGLTKKVPSFSTVTLTVTGTAGTNIVNGIATDTLSQQWVLPSPTLIPDAGFINVVATAAVSGAVDAESGTVTTIFTPTLGWQSVTNAAAATPGAPVESDAELRIRQTQSVANPSLTVFEGTIGSVENVAGVTKARGYENDTGSTDSNGIPAHKICLVVAGGVDAEIAEAIELRKTPGTGTYGDTTVLVFDSKGMPINIAFQRAVTATISAQITLAANDGWTTDFEPLIKAAVAAVINAGEIGAAVLLTKLFAPAYLNGAPQGLTYDIGLIQLKKNAGSFAAANVTLSFDENPVCNPLTDITIIVT